MDLPFLQAASFVRHCNWNLNWKMDATRSYVVGHANLESVMIWFSSSNESVTIEPSASRSSPSWILPIKYDNGANEFNSPQHACKHGWNSYVLGHGLQLDFWEKSAKTVSEQHVSSDYKRSTECVTVAADCMKLLLFEIFKGGVIGRMTNSLHQILPDRMYGCTQAKGWMDSRVMQLWKEEICKLYVEGTMRSPLLLNRMESRIHPDFVDTLDE